MANIVCFGEVLWDVFRNQKRIGGAPLNVALRLASFKNKVNMISAVGRDELGDRILEYVSKKGFNTDFIQQLSSFNTGEVIVTLNNKGSATYDIMYPRSWDKIQVTDDIKNLVQKSDALVFGSLITRDEVSRKTLYALIDLASYKIFDLNLRPPHYTKDILIYLMETADFIKFNEDELYEVSRFLGSKYNDLEQNVDFIASKTDTKHICVTKGEYGAVLLFEGKLYYNGGYKTQVADTVGAGDSFLGSLIHQLFNKSSPQYAIDFACAVGALVAQSEGANPDLNVEQINAFMMS